MKRALSVPLLALGLLGLLVAAGSTRPQSPTSSPGGPAIDRMVADAVVGEPWQHRNLTLFPIRLRRIADDTPYTTLSEAVKRGDLRITELVDAEVNRVQVRNLSNGPVFILSGEIIAGAKQDRMVEDDVLLPAGAEVALGVYCTEHGRWSGTTTSFGAAGANVHNRLRQVAKQTRSQERVWAEVEGKAESLQAQRPDTGAARRIYSQAEVQSRVRPYVNELEALPARFRDTVGVVAAAGSDILVADAFCNPSLFRKLWPRLLESYALDAVDRPGTQRPIDRDDAERFFAHAAQAALDERRTPGAGDLFDLSGRNGYGSALVYRGAVVHLDLFPRAGVAPVRPQRVPNLRYRRERQR